MIFDIQVSVSNGSSFCFGVFFILKIIKFLYSQKPIAGNWKSTNKMPRTAKSAVLVGNNCSFDCLIESTISIDSEHW